MQFEDIYRVSPKRKDVKEAEINAFEKKWGIKLPEDFRMVLKELGPGQFSYCLNIFWPQQMSKDHELYVKTMREAPEYYWKESKLTQKEALNSVHVASSSDGDFIVYHPGSNSGFFILPRHSETIEKLGSKFVKVVDWFANSKTKFKWFCTLKDRCDLYLIRDQYITHDKALLLLEEAFGKARHTEYEGKDCSVAFYPQISGYVLINSQTFSKISLGINYDSDFDAKVCQIVKATIYNQGFRKISHTRSQIA
jgi:hypothetical protein